MADFLVLLAKTNLAMAGAILIVALLRRPMRVAFHAPVAYALWLLVPAAALTSLLPPRVVAIAAHPVNVQIPVAMTQALPTPLVAQAAPFDWSLLSFVAWVIGAGAMLFFMARQQRQFHKAERLGAAGPAVTGFLRPRIVIPSGFATQFSAPEQAAILAHEKAHLARQDARINAVVALLRCLCWFNPLVQLGALWLRKDQELACDAAAMKRVSRVDYANALLKSQMRVMALPLGCSWPGGEHPLTERVALLKRSPPSVARQAAGAALVLSLTLLAGVGAWAAQPAQTKPGPLAKVWIANVVADKSLSGTDNKPISPKFFYGESIEPGAPAFFMTLEADRQEKSNGNRWLGHVVMHFPFGMAQADSASQDWPTDKTITLRGNVTLMSGVGILRGQKLVFDARTGAMNLDGKIMPSGMPKYVPCTKDSKNCKRF